MKNPRLLPDVGYVFRARIRNWARLYRDQRREGTSNLYPLLRRLWLINGLVHISTQITTDDAREDADLLDTAILCLSKSDREAIIGVYIRRRSTISLAHEAGDFVSTWDRKVAEAELNLKRIVENIENRRYNLSKLESATSIPGA